MSNKVKDNREEQRIRDDAEQKAQSKLDHLLPHQPAWRKGYIAGATKEAARNKEDSIGFAEWMFSNAIDRNNSDYLRQISNGQLWHDGVLNHFTTEQLYEIYEKWKAKKALQDYNKK